MTQRCTAARVRYLQRLRAYCQALPLAALGGDPSAQQDVTLDDVYIDLNTTARVPQTTTRRRRETVLVREDDTRLLPALEAFAQHPRLVLLGDPGSGKSTFVRKLLAWVAAAQVDNTAMPPGCAANLLPILVTLRDLAPVLARLDLDSLPAVQRRQRFADTVRDLVLDDLTHYEASDFRQGMQTALSAGACVLVLDGLDEVPTAVRARVPEAVAAVIAVYAVQRLIVTCRVRSCNAELPGIPAYALRQMSSRTGMMSSSERAFSVLIARAKGTVSASVLTSVGSRVGEGPRQTGRSALY